MPILSCVRRRILLSFVLVALCPAMISGQPTSARTSLAESSALAIDHLIIIFQENWSFDGLYGKFPGANGIANARETIAQVDKLDHPYSTLPQPIDNTQNPAIPDPRFPANLPVQPFDIALYVTPDQHTGDPIHRFYQQQYQIDGGRMDKFVAWSDTGGLVMSYFDATDLPEGRLAQQYTLADNFFHAAFGGSLLNHFWLICACTPTWTTAPAEAVAQFDASGNLTRDGAVTPDGYLVNNALSINHPRPFGPDITQFVPNLTLPTIGDRLSEKNVTWAWYTGGWNDALAGTPDPRFGFSIISPFMFFANFADGTIAKATHLKDEQDFLQSLRDGSLPSVSFVKPLGGYDEHPGYASLLVGQQHVVELVNSVKNSVYWGNTAIIVTYDENGGRWDHVSPPVRDRWGPGTRVPMIIISPYAKKGYVDHTLYDTTSILKFIETRWGLEPLGMRDQAANNLLHAFDFTSGLNQRYLPLIQRNQ